ncbi:MAG TPA: Gfo/Idh/MocA family oxidoreductase [Aggregatilineales bacterium]|nr:Gfo/Idh/MocA family oxidoreductase [Aggregatilineales bacterium]
MAFRYVLIGGAASIASTHIKALAACGATIAGLCDIDTGRGAARAAEIGCPFYPDHRVMLAEIKPDIAVILAPHPAHAALAIDALQSGAHVLSEKPIAVEVGQADAMIAAAEAAHRVLAVSFQHRFDPIVEYAHTFIEAGELGALVRTLCVEPWLRSAAYYRLNSWRGTWTGEGGGVLMNQSPHTLDLLCYLGGQPAKVWGWTRTRYQAMEAEDTAQAMLEYPNGAPGYFTASTAEAGSERHIQIVGEKATLDLAGTRLMIQRFDPPLREFIATDPNPFGSPKISSEVLDLPVGEGRDHVAVYRDLEAAITEGREPHCTGRDALPSLELANAIIYSNYRGGPVSLPLDRAAYSALLHDLMGKKYA